MNEPNDFKGQLFIASVDGGLPEQLPCRAAASVPFLRMGRKSFTIECLENSAHGNGIAEARQTMCGCTILTRK